MTALTSGTSSANPFALLLNPESVVAMLNASSNLKALHSKVYRPLDKPRIYARGEVAQAEFDAAVDGSGPPVFAAAPPDDAADEIDEPTPVDAEREVWLQSLSGVPLD